MILLKRLRVHAFKQLRDVEIWFPRRGSLLIEGQNESGKSTLFEAMYFGLYGVALVGEETRATLDDCIPHGGSAAGVELTVAAGQFELDIRRTVTFGRGRSHVTQQARVIVRRPGLPTEEIHGPRPVNARILQELHELDADTLRNSCFMEQKALDRLEALTRGQREVAIARLLGLDHLQRVARTLETESGELRKQLDVRRGELEVATWQRRAHEAGERARQWETRSSAADARELIAQRDAVEDTVAGKSERIMALREQMRETRNQVRAAEEVKELLDMAQATRAPLQEALANAQRLDGLVRELSELDRLEREEAIPLARRLTLLTELEGKLARARDVSQNLAALEELAAVTTSVEAARLAAAEARRALDVVEGQSAHVEVRDRLQEWIHATERTDLLGDGDVERERFTRARDEAQHAAQRIERRSRTLLISVTTLIVIAIVACAGGLQWRPLWGVAALALLLAIALGVTQRGVRRGLPATRAAASAAREALTRIEVRQELSRQLPGSPDDLPRIEDALRLGGVTPPTSLAEAKQQLNELSPPNEMSRASARDAREQARRALTQRETQRDAVEAQFATLQTRLSARFGGATDADLTTTLHELRAVRDEIQTASAEAAASAAVALDESTLAAERGAGELRLRLLTEQIAKREPLTQEIADTRATLEVQRGELGARIEEQINRARSLGVEAAEFAGGTNDLDRLDLTWKALHATVANAYMRLGEVTARERVAALASRVEELEKGALETGVDRSSAARSLKDALALQGVECGGDESLGELCILWPPLAEAESYDAGEIERELLSARNESFHARETAARAAKARNLEGIALDEATCRAQVERCEAELRRHDTAAQMAAETQARIFRRVLPETALHMRTLLPELTEGRYRDVELIADESVGGADLKIRVWDQLAGRYVAKNIFSGGTRDQCSLALRLAFALATLPKEVGATPGFVFLDEPLSSFDGERSRALVEILTRGAIARQFAQVMLVSHSRSFDNRRFNFRLRMAEGRIVESNLPGEREAERLWAIESAIVERAER